MNKRGTIKLKQLKILLDIKNDEKCYIDLSWLLHVPCTFLCSYYFQAPATQASQSQIYEK